MSCACARAGAAGARSAFIIVLAATSALALACLAGDSPMRFPFFFSGSHVVEPIRNNRERIAGVITFDVDNLEAAVAELDARYLAGEAAPYAQTWSLTLGTFAALNRQARQVGGDYYDVLRLGGTDGRHLLCVADISGKGLPAALLMSNIQATLRAITRTPAPLAELATMTNALLYA